MIYKINKLVMNVIKGNFKLNRMKRGGENGTNRM